MSDSRERELEPVAPDPEGDVEEDGEPEPLPGSVFLAERIERRKFLRRMSTSLFFGFTAVSTGTAGIFGFLASPAAAAGPCCVSSCCGPSPCCSTTCCNKSCCDPIGSDNCKNNGSTCLGYAGTWSGTSCWSCVDQSSCRTTTCCDCKTNNQTGCYNPSGPNRCICWHIFPYCAPQLARGPIIKDASEVPLFH